MSKVLMIDNYDSFTYNLVQCFQSLSLEIETYRHDQISLTEIEKKDPGYIVISPGPGRPGDAGISMEVIRYFSGKIPILGVCLGMQCINEVDGGRTVGVPTPIHGKTIEIEHHQNGIFGEIPNPATVALYHSLMVELKEKSDLKVTAVSGEGVVMALQHREFPLTGVQFHPESFMTPQGLQILKNFIDLYSQD